MDTFCAVGDLKEEESPATKIGSNAVVLLSIAKASDFDTLKSLRQVSSFWAQTISRVFTQQASINLKTGEKSLESLHSFTKDTEGNKESLKVLKIHCNSIATLELEEESAFNDILRHLSPSLETLELAPQNKHDGIISSFNPKFESNSQFPVLCSLAMCNMFHNTFQIVPKLFELTPALEHLELTTLGYPDFSFALSALQFTAEDGSIKRNWNLAPNLRSLTVRCSLSPSESEGLVAFPQTWEALNLCWNSRFEARPVATALEQLLEKNKDRLQYLRLEDVYYCESQAKVQLQFPSYFSKLKKLKFYFNGQDFDHMTFGFGRSCDLIKYSKMCPMLKSVQILAKHEGETELKSIWSKFFPQFVYNEGKKGLKLIVEIEGSERKVDVNGMLANDANWTLQTLYLPC